MSDQQDRLIYPMLNAHCTCGNFKEGRSHINCDAIQCENCGGWKSGLEIFREQKCQIEKN